MTSSTIELHLNSGIATLALNRPDKRNAMSDEMRADLVAALDRLGGDADVRAVVLTGTGKGFCAGGDVSGMERRMSAPADAIAFNGWSRQQRVHRAVAMLHSLPKPVIAAVNGTAAGLGADLAISCDFVVASEEATFAWSYIQRGLVPDGGGMYFLPRRVGLARAKELIFTGRRVDAAEALRLGIADRVSRAENLLADAGAWAVELSRGSAAAIALSKTVLNQSLESQAEQVFAQGSQAQGICYTTSEHRESVIAFLARAGQPRGE